MRIGQRTGESADLRLLKDEDGLTLTDGKMSLRADFLPLLRRIRKTGLRKEMLLRAVRIRESEQPLRVLDATAGFGEDAFILAAGGCFVQMYEKDPVIGALLEDALERGRKEEELSDILSRLRLVREDSVPVMRSLTQAVDVIYLDPMFPERQKSGLVKKKFQLLQRLERPCENGAELFEAAKSAHPKKIVVKRPLKGEFLGGAVPDYTLRGSVIRYDCYSR